MRIVERVIAVFILIILFAVSMSSVSRGWEAFNVDKKSMLPCRSLAHTRVGATTAKVTTMWWWSITGIPIRLTPMMYSRRTKKTRISMCAASSA